MPIVNLWFPGGRYHATPWGHHVNEGLIEWPPSPWRLLRAFIACGYATQGWSDLPPIAGRLISKLATVLPAYHLPPASAAHSRHFMPVGVLAKGREQTTLVFDTWANLGCGEVVIHWPCELDHEEMRLLQQLTSALSYLGRSESWVEARLTSEPLTDSNAEPCREGEHRGREWEQVSLMAPIPPVEYEKWRAGQIQEVLRPFENKKQSEATKKKRAQAIEPYPHDLLCCLSTDTAWWKGHGWSQPPGSQRVLYWRPSGALQVGVPTRRKQFTSPPVEFMVLALRTPSGNTAALPPVTRTVPQAEQVHKAIIRSTAQGGRVACHELTGHDEHGVPLRDQHQHAHTIPLVLNERGRIDHILVYSPSGLSNEAQQGIRRARRAFQKNGPELQVSVAGYGNRSDLYQLPTKVLRHLEGYLGPLNGCLVWESITPFVPPRFPKSRGKNSIEGQVQAELESRGLPAATSIELIPELTKSLRHFIRKRGEDAVQPKLDVGYGLRLTFPKPIPGPLLLGYASHYGLGLFGAIQFNPVISE